MTQRTPTNILIVDDEPYIRDILSRLLADKGYHCVTAANCNDAWTLLTANNIALILMDIMMQQKSGIALFHKVRKEHPNVAVIMVSALDRPKLITGMLELGAYGYLTKPFDGDEVVNHVASALQRREEKLLARDTQ